MLYESTDKFIENIDKEIGLQKLKRDNLHECLKKISQFTDELQDSKNLKKLFLIFENIKKSLDYVSENIELLQNLKNKNEKTQTDIDEFNLINQKIQKNNLDIEIFFEEYIKYCIFDINVSELKEDMQENLSNEFDVAEAIVENEDEKMEKEQESMLNDNRCLIISEMKKKVFLPYTIDEINKTLEDNKNKYNSVQDVIDDKFVVPLSRYKNPAIARFREAFNLMKYKENESLSKCLDLALELMLNSLLNPAVITACKNLDELDIYLDYLCTNELDKFAIFEVKYEIAPVKI